ncbi:flagellar hook-associated protein 3 [Pseudomonas xantholysinigenes]|uniref:Flagellar hook-associated protein 3 n=1 Tax=Pseudomonas xantholysinigenes TaxID=2745490 RepID=A0A9E6TVA4_9PSED|nr:flagellar hook-associated protein 3 [Pseudomonas xantholysinigenes]QXI37088.1 flagellar hook-associated protein 3 [Pseudomonas xantholysinigenes]
MRISTAQFYESSASSYTKNFADLMKSKTQIDSGVRIQTAADDPVGAARLLLLQQQQALLKQYDGNMTTVNNSLLQEESVLATINDAMQRASELALRAGGAGVTDADRVSISGELKEIEANIFGLLNSRDANGDYMFGGTKTSSPPYVRNADGTYSYQGDQTQLSLQVSDTLSLATNDTGFSIFDSAKNKSRTESTLVAPPVDDGKVALSPGLLTSNNSFNSSFTAGQPYKITFTSATQYKVTDALGNDITAETPTNGTFDSKTEGGNRIALRGVEFEVTVALKEGDDADAVLAGREFSVQARPDSLTAVRGAGNSSSAQVTSSAVTDQAAYRSTFPSNGAVIKFTGANTYEFYAQPLTADSKPVASGTFTAPSLTVAGVTYQVSGAPQAGDQFAVNANNHQNQSVLETLSQLRSALDAPPGTAGDNVAIKNAVASAVANLASAREQVDITRGSIGARGNSLDIQRQENTSLTTANKVTQDAIGNTDMADASIMLTLQQAMLEASQLAFSRISQLSLFNKL